MATVDERLDGLDERMAHIEQALPALVTRKQLQAAIAPLATRAELQAAIAPLPTREEMHAAIHSAIAPLATREEMHGAVAEDGERTRTYMKVLIEDVRDEIRLIAEGHVALDKRDLSQHRELKKDVAALDTPVTRLEVSERRRLA